MSVRSKFFHLGVHIDQWLAASRLLRRSSGKAQTVFFPGCSLAGYSPSHVISVRGFLRERRGGCGLLMACCAKPLKLMGANAAFQRRIDAVRQSLDVIEAETVVTACQNCFKILREYEKGRDVVSLWPLLLELGLPDGVEEKYGGLEVSIQDSCAMGDYPEVALSVREILKRLGVTVREMGLSGPKARCCGGIQMITTGEARIGREAMRNRAAESCCPTILSYCASCRSAMGIDGSHQSLHLLDLLFGNGEPLKGGGLLSRWRVARLAGREAS